MSSRLRVLLTVAGAAALAAGAVLGITLATRHSPAKLQPLEGKPGVPRVLPTEAAEAATQIRTAFADWPDGSLDTMQRLGREYPRDPVVQLYLGIAMIWAGYRADAVSVLERVKTKNIGYDTPWEIQADTLLHPEYFRGDPPFVQTGPNPLLRRGVELAGQGRRHSAERLYLRAVKQNPENAEAHVAAAVARFDKGDLSASFSRLGPLARRYPRSQSVRFHLGLLLVWTGQPKEAVVQFEKTVALGKATRLGSAAQVFLTRIGTLGSEPPGK